MNHSFAFIRRLAERGRPGPPSRAGLRSEKYLNIGEACFGEGGLELPQDPGQEREIGGLAIAPGKPHEDAGDPGMTLGAEQMVPPANGRFAPPSRAGAPSM